jgi:hypothetical protein
VYHFVNTKSFKAWGEILFVESGYMVTCNNNCDDSRCDHDEECVEKWCINEFVALGPQFCCDSRRCAHLNVKKDDTDEDRLKTAYKRISKLEDKLKTAYRRISILKTELEFIEYISRR